MLFKNLKEDLVSNSHKDYKNKVMRVYPRNVNDVYFEILDEPFGNCQMCSIAWFEWFIRDCDTHEEFIENLKYVYNKSGKKLIIIDISNGNLLKMKNYIKESNYSLKDMINFIKPYVSTNGSNMNIVQLNLKKTILK